MNDLFTQDPSDLGKTDIVVHRINIPNEVPRKKNPYTSNSHSTKEFIDQEVERMLEWKVIEPCQGPWASPVVVVKKKTGDLRFCVDYRDVNDQTIPIAYPMPSIAEIFDAMQKAKWMTSYDLDRGYWQVEMAPEDRDKTAFVTRRGLFRFIKMPFGLKNAPATFQQLMDYVLRDYIGKFVQVYIDDINIYSETFEDHLKHIRLVNQKLREAGLKLKKKKCFFMKKKLEFLGHVITRNGLEVDPKKIDKVKNWPVPTKRKEVQRFMGFVNYYRRFIPYIATIAKPLYKLTKKDADFDWDEEHQKAFEQIREKLCSTEVMALPDFTRKFRLTTDASATGLGAVLEQVDDNGKARPIAYASKVLKDAETRYSATELELYAIAWAMKYFNQYLEGREFELHTDHQPLLGQLKVSPLQSARKNKWINQITLYTFKAYHVKGKQNVVADALSRKDKEPSKPKLIITSADPP
jgi:hypothetical protein